MVLTCRALLEKYLHSDIIMRSRALSMCLADVLHGGLQAQSLASSGTESGIHASLLQVLQQNAASERLACSSPDSPPEALVIGRRHVPPHDDVGLVALHRSLQTHSRLS